MNGDFTAREWQNGELCTAHGLPHCTPCFQALMRGSDENEDFIAQQNQRMEQLRDEVIRRIRAGEYHHSRFHRPVQRNFFEDKRRQFAAACQLGKGNYIFIPLAFVIVDDDKAAHRASDEEVREILLNEHRWDTSTPEWAQHDVPALEDEDTVLLREFQLFKS
jgi:hypothetical protein